MLHREEGNLKIATAITTHQQQKPQSVEHFLSLKNSNVSVQLHTLKDDTADATYSTPPESPADETVTQGSVFKHPNPLQIQGL